jgi:NAD+ synthetase
MRTERYEKTEEMSVGLVELLQQIRFHRGFNAERCIEAKSILINRYFRKHGLSSAVVGVSGGIDSAVTLGLLKHAASVNGSPIRRITPLLLPFSIDQGVSNQEFATSRGVEVVRACGLTPQTIDLAAAFTGVRAAFTASGQEAGDAWADGQLAAYLRTPALYYAVALNTQQGFPGILCGTTNRDEGAYLGFFGKASDGMVDLQIISDLHKSEIYGLARALNTPAITIDTPPTGDVYDGKTHLDMIGAPYDFVELYLTVLCQGDGLIEKLEPAAREQFAVLGERVEAMHRYNRHKYMGGNPSVHLDIYQRCVPGGWEESPGLRKTQLVKDRKLVAEFSIDSEILKQFTFGPIPDSYASPLGDCQESGAQIGTVLTRDECSLLTGALERTVQIPVGRNGMKKDFDAAAGPVGSYRATLYSEELAELVWKRIEGRIPAVRCFDDYSCTDSAGHPVWRAVGINPSLRFIKYLKGGTLVPHYDAGYDFCDGRRHTLMSVVIYLTDGAEGCGGRTRFILDSQRNQPSRERDYSDWSRAADSREILLSVQPKAGSALVFDHRLLHDAEGWEGDTPRIIMRTDIIFERCGEAFTEASPVASSLSSNPLKTRDLSLEKARQDPFFRHTCEKFGCKELVEAGFFDDGATEPFNPASEKNVMSTALHKVVKNYTLWSTNPKRACKTPAVLLTTGGFCPVHRGHLSMMESARQKLEEEGYAVLGGFLAPDHDDYINQKCGKAAISAAERLHFVDLATEDSDWLAADPWAALYADRALNFTDVIRRMEVYLAHHLCGMMPVRVVYVCGGDNALFARTFVGRGSCVIAHRPGEGEKMGRLQAELDHMPTGRIYLAAAHLADPAASRLIREGATEHLPEKLQSAWNARKILAHGSVRVYLRDEGSWSTSLWADGREAVELERARKDFLAGIRLAFIKVFNTSTSRRDFAFRTVSAAQQQLKLKEYMKRRRTPLVSLDTVIPAEKNISISRCFELSDSRRRGDFITRPGSPALKEQLNQLGQGKFIFYDDDIATGQTTQALANCLPAGCQIEEFLSLFSLATGDELNTVEMIGEGRITDIGDLRDFLVGSRDGGLTVMLPDGTLARAPYLLPYVRNTRRMSIPVTEEFEFSRLLWKLNLEFFLQLSKPITVSECSKDFQVLALSLGWSADTRMQDFVLWHIQKLGQPAKEILDLVGATNVTYVPFMNCSL